MRPSFYHRYRNEMNQKRNQEILADIEIKINRIENIIAKKDDEFWSLIQMYFKEELRDIQDEIGEFEKLSEVSLKMKLKEQQILSSFIYLFNKLEYEVQNLKKEYDRIKAKVQVEQLSGKPVGVE